MTKTTLNSIAQDIKYMKDDIREIKACMPKIEENDKKIALLEKDVGMWKWGITALTLLGTSIASYLGVRK